MRRHDSVALALPVGAVPSSTFNRFTNSLMRSSIPFAPMRALLVAVCILLAGCVAVRTPGDVSSPQAHLDDPVEPLPTEAIAPAPSSKASFKVRESRSPSLLPAECPQDIWPRTYAVSFAGRQETLDAFARTTPAYVLTYEEIWCETDGLTAPGQGRNVPTQLTFYYDAADAAVLSMSVDGQYKSFADLEFRHPYSSPLLVSLAGMHVRGAWQTSVPLWAFHLHGTRHVVSVTAEPFSSFRPLAGDCTMHEFVVRVEPPLPEEFSPTPTERWYDLICLEADDPVPLWWWRGTTAKNVSIERLTSGFVLPPLQGIAHPDPALPRASWVEVGPLGGLAEPVMMPPSNAQSDFAAAFHSRAEVGLAHPSYALDRPRYGLPYLEAGLMGVLLPEGTSAPVGPGNLVFDEYSVMSFRAPDATYHAQVLTRHGDAEGSESHVFDLSNRWVESGPFVTTYAPLVPLVPAGTVQTQLLPLLPPIAQVAWVYHALGEGLDSSAFWILSDPCSQDPNALSAYVDARRGALMLLADMDDGACLRDGSQVRATVPLWAESTRLPSQPVSPWFEFLGGQGAFAHLGSLRPAVPA